MSIATVRAGLVTAAKGVNASSGLGKIRGSEFRPDSFNPPHFAILNYRLDFDESYGRGLDKLTFDCAMVVARASERTATAALDAYVSALKAALEADQSLSGSAQACRITSMPNYVPMPSPNESEFRLAAPLTVEVFAAI